MTVTDQINILAEKIKSNQAQYDLGREPAKISALPSKNLLGKYEYLTGEDLGYKPNVFERAKFEYFPSGMSLSKAFKKDAAKMLRARVILIMVATTPFLSFTKELTNLKTF